MIPSTWRMWLAWKLVHMPARLLGLIYFRATLANRRNMPAGRVIVAPVHRSNLDVPLLGAVSRRRLRYLAKDSLFRRPAISWFLTSLGGFPVRRGQSDRDALRAAITVLEAEEPLVVFPEGERKSGPLVHPAFTGAAWLSAKTGAPILPVGICGSERALPVGAKLPRPKRIRFVYGTPIPPPQAADGGRVKRPELRAHTEQLRDVLQRLLDGCGGP